MSEPSTAARPAPEPNGPAARPARAGPPGMRHGVFWPPFLLFASATAYSLVAPQRFLDATSRLNRLLLDRLSLLYAWGGVLFLALCVAAYFSPLGRVRIGGESARPLMSRLRWFAITLCTTVAIGILFWGAAEPISHLHGPPAFARAAPGSAEAARFALSTMYLHWSFTPYAMYALAGLVFALMFYNRHQRWSLGSLLAPILGARAHGVVGAAVDALCLFSLVAGMAATLGAGLLILGGGIERQLGIAATPAVLGVLAFLIVGTFVVSAITGLLRGIRLLSEWNFAAFVAIVAFFFVAGPTRDIVVQGGSAFADYIVHFLPRSLLSPAAAADRWVQDWTIFYWANWLAWTPVTAIFLGRLALGYTVRDFLHVNLVATALFGCVWMAAISGTALAVDTQGPGAPLGEALRAGGPESVMFALFDRLPWRGPVTGFFLAVAFLSYVTGADSNTGAMAGLSSTGISPESPEPSARLKVAWGLAVALPAWVLVAFAGIDGVRMASNLGGAPALFLMLAVAVSALRLILRPKLAQFVEPREGKPPANGRAGR